MPEKNIKRMVVKQLKRQFPNWGRLPDNQEIAGHFGIWTGTKGDSCPIARVKSGRLKIDKAKIAAEEKRDGKYLLITNDETLSAGDVALGYKQLLRVEEELSGPEKRHPYPPPMYHHAPHRIHAHVSLWMIALLLEHIAERGCDDTWRNLRNQLSKQKISFLEPKQAYLVKAGYSSCQPHPANTQHLQIIADKAASHHPLYHRRPSKILVTRLNFCPLTTP